MCKFSSKSLEVVGRSCPLLKSFKINDRFRRHINRSVRYIYYDDALAISGTMHNLLLLEIRGNELTCMGLANILDCCPQLNSLDLRQCQKLKRMSGELERRCAERIKKLWLRQQITIVNRTSIWWREGNGNCCRGNECNFSSSGW